MDAAGGDYRNATGCSQGRSGLDVATLHHAVFGNIGINDGADAIRLDLTERVTAALSGADFPAATRRRHAVHLSEAAGHIERALGVLALGSELAAEDVRLAARALERVTGKIDPEDVLGAVFSTFCIGK